MKDLFRFVLLGAALYAIGWFVSFQYDPYRVCRNHPTDKRLYLCEPFGFELEKGTRLERPDEDRFPWEKKGDVIIGTAERKAKQKQNYTREEIKDEWDCKDEFFLLGPDQWKNINIEDYCKYKGPKLRQQQNEELSPESLPNINEEL